MYELGLLAAGMVLAVLMLAILGRRRQVRGKTGQNSREPIRENVNYVVRRG